MTSFGNALSGQESIVEFRAKFIKQVLDFGAAYLADESHMGVLARAMSKHFVNNPNPSLEEFREVVAKLMTTRSAEEATVNGAPTLSDDPYSYFGWIPCVPGVSALRCAPLSYCVAVLLPPAPLTAVLNLACLQPLRCLCHP